MTLEELKVRMRIPIENTSKDVYLTVMLEDAIEYVKDYCNNQFKDGLPGGVKKAIVLLVKSAGENSNIASQSLDGMSKSFFQGQSQTEAHDYLKPYRKARFR